MNDFYNNLTELEKQTYECGYRKCKEEMLRILMYRKPYFDIFDELNIKLENHIEEIKNPKSELLNTLAEALKP